jgi:hypothetical protein
MHLYRHCPATHRSIYIGINGPHSISIFYIRCRILQLGDQSAGLQGLRMIGFIDDIDGFAIQRDREITRNRLWLAAAWIAAAAAATAA